jgi:TnpA family transposase
MAKACGLTKAKLDYADHWYFREETLVPANAAIVDFIFNHPLAQLIGDGSFNSSDGRRVQVTARGSQHAKALPRYFGLGRGVTFYTWTSDQHSHYASRVVRTSLRDATYVLDGILDNQTELPISKHTTDTAGYSVMWTVGCVKGRRHQFSAGLIGSPSSSRRCARRAAVQRWRSTSRGQPRCSASSARRSSVSRRVRSLGA